MATRLFSCRFLTAIRTGRLRACHGLSGFWQGHFRGRHGEIEGAFLPLEILAPFALFCSFDDGAHPVTASVGRSETRRKHIARLVTILEA